MPTQVYTHHTLCNHFILDTIAPSPLPPLIPSTTWSRLHSRLQKPEGATSSEDDIPPHPAADENRPRIWMKPSFCPHCLRSSMQAVEEGQRRWLERSGGIPQQRHRQRQQGLEEALGHLWSWDRDRNGRATVPRIIVSNVEGVRRSTSSLNGRGYRNRRSHSDGGGGLGSSGHRSDGGSGSDGVMSGGSAHSIACSFVRHGRYPASTIPSSHPILPMITSDWEIPYPSTRRGMPRSFSSPAGLSDTPGTVAAMTIVSRAPGIRNTCESWKMMGGRFNRDEDGRWGRVWLTGEDYVNGTPEVEVGVWETVRKGGRERGKRFRERVKRERERVGKRVRTIVRKIVGLAGGNASSGGRDGLATSRMGHGR